MKTSEEAIGIFNLAKNGVGYVKVKEIEQIIEIPSHHTNTALNKDLVRIIITDWENKIGEVLAIEKRAKSGFSGVLRKEGENYILSPSDFHDPEIIVEGKDITEEILGKKVFVKITEFRNDGKIIGQVVRTLGDAGNNDAEMLALALERGFDYEFPSEVIEEAEALEKAGIGNEEIKKRLDMRKSPTFTIDPADAKDFDDAISFEKLNNGDYRIGIHIADVSHYVTPGSAMDVEAQERTTSVYLVDRTIPMLPEAISNGLCSLNPGDDKLAFSAVFEIEPKSGKVSKEWFGRTIINSNKRFTYEEAQEVIDKKDGVFKDELLELNRLARVYELKRFTEGALNFETDEVKFILDDSGHPIAAHVKERIATNKLIEEFMLLANSRVAEYMSKNGVGVFVYRIHDRPDPEKMKFLGDFLSSLGYKISYEDGIIPSHVLQDIVSETATKDERDTVNSMIIRSMQKAIYSTENIGHYGLAFQFYTHFTSPIRRYPDVMVHRLLAKALAREKSGIDKNWYERMCQVSSEREKDAAEAERNSVKYKQVEFMGDRIGKIFNGIVTGTSKFGVFVAEEESRSEGMIHMSNLGQDYFVFDEKKREIYGQKTGIRFRVGNKLKIRVKEANLETKMINYERIS